MNTRFSRKGGLFIFSLLVGLLLTSVFANSAQSVSAAPAALQGASGGPPLPYTEIQAENAAHNGTVIGPDRFYPGLATEAIGRRAVTLTGLGKYVEFTVPAPANSIVIRYSIPDNAAGTGINATLSLYINGAAQPDLPVTSKYGWIYGTYPFTNDPNGVRPHHFYDEVQRLTPQMAAGTKVRVQIDSDNTAPSYTIDLINFEQVAPPASQPAGSLSLIADFGADPTDTLDSTTAIQNAVNAASSQGKVLWVPPGIYRANTQIRVNNVTIRGAGIWHSRFHFTNPNGSNEGFYGNYAPNPSRNVHLSDFAIFGEVVTRVDNDQINGIGGALTDSTITNLWIEHTKCGMWLDGPFDNLKIDKVRIRNQNADGINFHKGVTNSSVTNSFFRNTGDDALAMWSDSNGTTIANANNTFAFNRVEMPVLANGIALYGGTNNSVTDNYVAEQQAEGGGIHVGNRFWPVTPVSGTTLIARNTIIRAGSQDYYNAWNFGTGALWFYALNAPMNSTIIVEDNQIIDSNYNAIHFIGDHPITNITFNRNQIIGAGTYGIEIRSSGSAMFNNTTATGLGRGSVFGCRNDFTIVKGPGNGSWLDAAAVCPNPYPTPIYAPIATNTPTSTPTPCPGGVCPPSATPTHTPTVTRTPTNTPVPTPIPGTVVAAVNAGGGAAGNYIADTWFDQGNQFSDASTPIDTSGFLDTNIAPQAVYQNVRWNPQFTYTIPGLTPNASYVVILHWAELSFQQAGARVFNVAINGSSVLSNFDVYAVAGYKRALGRAFNVTANGSGQIVVAFTRAGADNPFINGIEVLSQSPITPTRTHTPSRTPTATNTQPTFQPPTNTNTPGSGDGTPYGGTAVSLPGTVQAENYNLGGQGVAYSDLDVANQGGQYRTSEGVDIEAASDSGGGFNVGYMRAGEWLKYTVNVTTAGSYTLDFRVASGVATGSFYVEVDGTNVTGTVNVPNTGSWQTWQTISRSGINLSAGQHVVRLVVTGNDANLNWIGFSIPSGNNGTPYGGTAVSLPGTVQAENYNLGGQGVAYSDLEAANQGGQYRTSEGVDIETTTDTGGGFNVAYTRTGEWLKYTVNVTTAGTYTLDFRVANGTATGAFYLEVDGVNVTGTMNVPNTGGWQTWQTVTRSGINLSAGQHVFRLVITGNDSNFNWIRVR
jgi:hypothetical protein